MFDPNQGPPAIQNGEMSVLVVKTEGMKMMKEKKKLWLRHLNFFNKKDFFTVHATIPSCPKFTDFAPFLTQRQFLLLYIFAIILIFLIISYFLLI